ncbi:MAG: 5-formyltetrahydrofolate cyclo-ligase [Chlorobiota bacterium]|nr:5-formyltetrahydrofolate cyclo-ligase [Chlorobiota bacterium]
MTKAELRRIVLERRAALPEPLRRWYSERIAQWVLQHPWVRDARAVHVYCSVRGEVHTELLRQRLLEMGKRVAVPVVRGAQLLHAWVTLESTYRPGQWGIPEPEVPDEALQTAEQLGLTPQDVVLVPLVGYDRRLFRLGYGRGFYDGFLRGVPARRVGLAFSVQFVPEIPSEPHDVALDAVVTECGVLYPLEHAA